MSIAEELITRGWTQGRYEDEETGEVCLVGAACRAFFGYSFNDSKVSWEDAAAADKVVRRALPDGWDDVACFNDSPGRTYDEVLRVAKLADEILDA